MKKFLLIGILITSTFTIKAQSFHGQQSLLGQIGYQSNYDRLLLGVQYRYVLFNNFRFAPDATFYFPNKDITGLDFNINLQYSFNVDNQLSAYPLAGLNMANNRFSGKYIDGVKIESDGYTDWGFNLGGGITYYLSKKASFINIEAKYVFSTTDAFSIGVGYGVIF